ncbi:helix-turn-helix domain-containing protein [Arthrobacter cavernae]|uniref:Helix-turn-helix domain-containing protein n=1 Tax=Arthrobacter cavernae TaxID=2817681 RepID=A0A939KJF6_9MICC|nr:helix-turn-helix domain-containing protein [Arthrobacter cavernae]MBO1267674.1 helix-turn-helix domain-containing protein [Arthrobacter cavernae]
MYRIDHADSFAGWRRLISSSFVPLGAEPVRRGPFRGQVGGRRLNEVGMMQVEACAHTVVRTPELIAAGGVGQYKLSLQLGGHGLLLQDGRETVLRPGDLAIYDTQRPYTLTYDEDFRTLVLMFPQHLLGLSPQDVSELTAVRLGNGQRLGEAVAPFVAQIGQMLPTLEGPIGYRLAMNIVDLLSTLLADEVYSRPGQAADGHGRLLRRIQHHIDAHLADPQLDPPGIAAAHFISTRTLHQLFADAGHTVAGWIRERRLERCRRDLLDPLHADVPVGAIGARWGLPDAAHFSRVFRGTFGASPTQYRRAAQAAVS